MNTDIYGLKDAVECIDRYTSDHPQAELTTITAQLKAAALRLMQALGAVYIAEDQRLSQVAELAIRREGYLPAAAGLAVMLSALPAPIAEAVARETAPRA